MPYFPCLLSNASITPSAWGGERLLRRLAPKQDPSLPAAEESRGEVLLSNCRHQGSCWALGPQEVPSDVAPIATSV